MTMSLVTCILHIMQSPWLLWFNVVKMAMLDRFGMSSASSIGNHLLWFRAKTEDVGSSMNDR